MGHVLSRLQAGLESAIWRLTLRYGSVRSIIRILATAWCQLARRGRGRGSSDPRVLGEPVSFSRVDCPWASLPGGSYRGLPSRLVEKGLSIGKRRTVSLVVEGFDALGIADDLDSIEETLARHGCEGVRCGLFRLYRCEGVYVLVDWGRYFSARSRCRDGIERVIVHFAPNAREAETLLATTLLLLDAVARSVLELLEAVAPEVNPVMLMLRLEQWAEEEGKDDPLTLAEGGTFDPECEALQVLGDAGLLWLVEEDRVELMDCLERLEWERERG